VGSEAQRDAGVDLKRYGLRSTRQRAAVLWALRAEPNDATAQEIHRWLTLHGERIGLATVYRTLELLNNNGVVDVMSHRRGELCYRLCGEGHHHHLVCHECHRVVEVGDCDLTEWLDELAAEHGFTIRGHIVEVTGVCANCLGSGV
jgi:Fur family transcriptional regulator, ferric uptake regulator